MKIPENRPFDIDVWNTWASIPESKRPMLDMEFVQFQLRLAELFLKIRKGTNQ